MAGGLMMGGPPTEPGNVGRAEVFPPAVGPGLGQRPLERPAVDRVPHQRRHDAGSSPPILAVDVNGPVATIADEREELLGVVVRRWRARREGQPENPLEAEPRVVGILLGAEVDHRLDALPPQPPPSLLASRLPGPREPVLPD